MDKTAALFKALSGHDCGIWTRGGLSQSEVTKVVCDAVGVSELSWWERFKRWLVGL